MRRLLPAVAGCALLGGTAFAAQPPPPPPPHPVTVRSSTIVTGGGTVTNNLHVGSVNLSASVSDKATIGVVASISAGFITP